MSGSDALPLVASTVTCEPLHPCNVLRAVRVVSAHALRAFRSNTLVVKRASRRSHHRSTGDSHVERESLASGQSRRHHRHHRADDAEVETERGSQHSRRSTGERRSRSADDGLASTNASAASRHASARRSRSSDDAAARSRLRSRSGEAAGDRTSQASSAPTKPGTSRSSPSLPPLRPPPPPPAVASLGGLTASRLHSNNSSFNSAHGALPPMTGKPPLSGQRSGATPRAASADDSRRSATGTAGEGSARGRESRRHQPRPHDRTSSRDSTDSQTHSQPPSRSASADAAARRERDPTRSSSSSRPHRDARTSAASVADDAGSAIRVTPAPLKRKSLHQRMAEWDVTRWAYGFTHLMRAGPAKLVHGYCTLQRQLATLPLLRFRDEGVRGHALLDDCMPSPGERVEDVSQLYLNPALGLHFVLIREMLRACGGYVSECLLMDNSLVIRLLRSRRASRKTLGWLVRLSAHTLVDPIFLSVVTPLLLIKLRTIDSTAALAESIHVTRAGLVRGAVMGGASVILERLVMPGFSRLVNRAVVTICESTEYVLMRRYRTWPESSNDDDDDDEDDEDDEDEANENEGDATTAPADVSVMSGATATSKRGADVEADRRRRRRRARRKRREARERAEEAAMHRAILRAIVYRVAGTLASQCLVEHPLQMLVEILRSRAVMHAAGLLRQYDPPTSTIAPIAAVVEETAATRFWSSLFAPAAAPESSSPSSALSDAHSHSNGARTRRGGGGGDDVEQGEMLRRVVDVLRVVGGDFGYECRALRDTLTDAAGQTEAINALVQHAQAEVEAGRRPTARESAELLGRTLVTMGTLYSAIQVTVVDRLVTFYVEVWTRLTK